MGTATKDGKSIWFGKPDFGRIIEAVNARGKGTMSEYLGIVFTEAGNDYIKGTMPVDHRTKQPAGILHGGASVVLAETLGSTAANIVVDHTKQYCVGLDINANHIRSCKDGVVEGTTRPLHIGKTTQVWEIKITQEGKLVCVSRITMAVLERK
jgi:1,4-dihydroxy-2-naphthoyl-CoA hydrolase